MFICIVYVLYLYRAYIDFSHEMENDWNMLL